MASHTGKVKFYNEEKGFGFIIRDDGQGDVFMHKSALLTRAALQTGEAVKFDVKMDTKGPKAIDVQRA